MSNIIALDSKLPAHIAALGNVDTDEWTTGTTAGFPIISVKGKVFHIKRGEELTLVEDPNEPGEAARSLNIVVVKANRGVTKTFYERSYEEGSSDKPDCYSLDGIRPAQDAENRQCKTCAACPMNQWGSRKTESGKDAKRCSDVKRLAVCAAGQLNDPMLLRVPPTSLRTWDQYTDLLKKRNLTPAQVITKLSFDPNVAHQALVFKAVDFITDAMVKDIVESRDSTVVESMLGSIVDDSSDTPPADTDSKDEAKKPAAKKPAAKKAAPKKEPEPEPEPEEDAEEDAEAATQTDLDDFDFDDDDFDFDD